MFEIKLEGLDELQNQLGKFGKEIENKLEKISQNVTFEDLFTEEFMAKHTKTKTIDQLFEKGNLKVESKEEFDEGDENKLSEIVKEYTVFNSWREMIEKAGNQYVINEFKKIGIPLSEE